MSLVELVEALEGIAALVEKKGDRGTYYMEETILKRSYTGDSASGPCPTCDDNEAMGWIDVDAIYESGHDAPPFHPRCVCGEEYREGRKRVYY